jgi:hypothetical protein
MSNAAPPVLDYANPLPAQPVTSDIVLDVREDGFAFVVPPGSRRRAVGGAIASALAGLLVCAFGIMIIRDIGTRASLWLAVVLTFMAGSIAALVLFARLAYLRSAHPTVIVTQAGALLWHRPTVRGMRWTRWERGSIRKVHARSAGHSLGFQALGDVYVVTHNFRYTNLFSQRELKEMRWLADCLRRLVAT